MNNNHSKNPSISGRSTSQVSIYDYPEHLNPFYEDENHKRIRFFKIGSSKNSKTARSNSFSLNGLKEIWAFKSFKLSKKRSSTLGINKTSESPPVLRRQIHPVYDTYSTVDSRLRHTVDVGLGDNFLRNSVHRSSLQDVTGSRTDVGIYRNDRYRSTLQNGFKTIGTPQSNRYYGGAGTPTPQSRYLTTSYMHGSSQSSLNSTNPFDEDDTISQAESIDSASPVRRSRKKRRAPPPPIASSTPSKVDIHPEIIKENSLEEKESELLEFSNLTSQIESFVKTADTDCEKIQIESSKSNETNEPVEKVEKTTEGPLKIEIIETTKNDDLQIRESVVDKKRIDESRQSPENNDEYPERVSQSPEKENPTILSKSHSEKQLNITRSPPPPRIIVRLASNESETSNLLEIESENEIKTDEQNDEIKSGDVSKEIKSNEMVPSTSNQNQCESKLVTTDELKITENTDSQVPIPQLRSSTDRYNIRFIALKNYSPESVRRETEASKSVKKPDKRRTVKDIIASINKSQSLLRINRDKHKKVDSMTNTMPLRKTDDVESTRKFDTPLEQINEKQFNQMISEMETTETTDDANIPIMVERFDELNNNNSDNNDGQMFKKCTIRRNDDINAIQTDTNTFNRTSSGLEWNPVPKPRRSKQNLGSPVHDIENGKPY